MISLQELFKEINVYSHIKNKVKGITIDSRKVKDGYIFVAIRGAHFDGYDFIEDAIERGAICIISDRDFKTKSNKDFDRIITTDLYDLSTKFALMIYDNPSSKMKLIGVTGTNGKTTTTYILEAIFQKAGYKTGVIGTIQNKIGDKILKTENTTPFPTELQSVLFEMAKAKVEYVFMEVSSHALQLDRVKGCAFDAAVFTNLTKEHLDFHITMKNYALAKKKLFGMLRSDGVAIINGDDKYSEKILEGIKGIKGKKIAESNIFSFSRKHKTDFYAKNIKFDKQTFKLNFEIMHKKQVININTNLIGLHNVENILAAVSVAVSQKIKPKIIEEGIKNLEHVEGRFEFVREGQDFACIIDYAHTDDALSRVLRTCRKLKMNRIITVFGCGGDRDRKKRPLMAKASAKYSDFVIITNDNPRDEDSKRIFTDIELGFNEIGFSDYEIIENREDAIEKALQIAKTLDIVLIAGKGHENYQILGREVKDFSDKKVAKQKIHDILTTSDPVSLF